MMGSVHIEIDDNLTAKEIHALTQKIRYVVYKEIGIALTIGIYASNESDERYAPIKEYINSLTKDNPDVLQVHGFYVFEEEKTVSFDLIVDFDADRATIRKDLLTKLEAKFPEYKFMIVDDYDVSD